MVLPVPGAAGNDAQPAFDGRSGGGHGRLVRGGAEHARQCIAEVAPGHVRGQGMQARGKSGFGFEQAVQIQAVAVQHQRTWWVGGAASYHRTGRERGAPGSTRRQPDREHVLGHFLAVFRGWPFHDLRKRLAGLGERQAGVTGPVHRAYRRRRQHHLRAGAQVRHRPGEEAVDVGEHAGFGEHLELIPVHHDASPRKQASIASMQAREGRSR